MHCLNFVCAKGKTQQVKQLLLERKTMNSAYFHAFIHFWCCFNHIEVMSRQKTDKYQTPDSVCRLMCSVLYNLLFQTQMNSNCHTVVVMQTLNTFCLLQVH